MTNKTTGSLLPFIKLVIDPTTMNVEVEDNLPDDLTGRSMVASALYGAFQAVSNEIARIAHEQESKIALPTTDTVEKVKKGTLLTAKS